MTVAGESDLCAYCMLLIKLDESDEQKAMALAQDMHVVPMLLEADVRCCKYCSNKGYATAAAAIVGYTYRLLRGCGTRSEPRAPTPNCRAPATNMWTLPRRARSNVVLAAMSSACVLRLPTISTQAFALSVNSIPASDDVNRARCASCASFPRHYPRCRVGSARPLGSCRPQQLRRDHAARYLTFCRSVRLSMMSPSGGGYESGGERSATQTSSSDREHNLDVSNSSARGGIQEDAEAVPARGTRGFGEKAKGFSDMGEQARVPKQKQQQRPTTKPQAKAPPRGKNLLIVGLGNPGDKFKFTRHNAGFLVAEELARRHGGSLKIRSSFQGEYCSISLGGRSVGILRPTTFMNNSGMAARKVMDFFKLPVNAALVVVDEVSLDFGQLRMKPKGSAGGHNGLKSIQTHLKTPEYTRLRIGVGASRGGALSDHVLGEFSRAQAKDLDNVIADACDAVELWIQEEDLGKVMTRLNGR